MSNPAKETNRLSKFVTEPGTGREEKIRRRDATGPDFVVDSYAARTGLSQVRGARSGFERAAIALVPGFSLSGAVQYGTAGISVLCQIPTVVFRWIQTCLCDAAAQKSNNSMDSPLDKSLDSLEACVIFPDTISSGSMDRKGQYAYGVYFDEHLK